MGHSLLTSREVALNIPSNNTDIWLIRGNASNFEYSQRNISILSDDEFERSKAFRFTEHRRQYLLVRFCVRNILSAYKGTPSPEKWVFRKNAFGRPYIDSALHPIPIFFSISHTKDMIAIAVSDIKSMGVDAEKHDKRINSIEISSSFFSHYEHQQLIKLPENKQKERFYDLWTLKESYIKAIGKGLSIPLNSFELDFVTNKTIDINQLLAVNDSELKWLFKIIPVEEGYSLSLCLGFQSTYSGHRIQLKEVKSDWNIQDINIL